MIKALWQLLTAKLVRRASVFQAHHLPAPDDDVVAMPIGERYDGLGDCPMIVARETPLSERPSPRELRTLKIALQLKRWIPLSRSYPQPFTSTGSSFPKRYERFSRPPRRPEALDEGRDLLAEVATRGPFSFYTTKRGDDTYEIDLSALEEVRPRAGFMSCGGRAVFTSRNGKLETLRLEGWGRAHEPGSEGFELARRRFLTGLNTFTTFVDHLLQCHLITCGAFAVRTIQHLPAAHPLRILLQPAIVETIKVNNYNIDGLIRSESSNVPVYTGYPLSTLYGLMRETATDFRLSRMDPNQEARARGTANLEEFVTTRSARDLWKIFADYCREYCEHYLQGVDKPVRRWVRGLDGGIPGGVKEYLGVDSVDAVDVGHVAKLACVVCYGASVKHYLVGESTRDYFLYPYFFPTVVPEGGGGPPTGIAMEKTNSIVLAGISRYRLIDPTVPTPDETGIAIRDRFFDALLDYRVKALVGNPELRYVIDPKQLLSSIHA